RARPVRDTISSIPRPAPEAHVREAGNRILSTVERDRPFHVVAELARGEEIHLRYEVEERQSRIDCTVRHGKVIRVARWTRILRPTGVVVVVAALRDLRVVGKETGREGQVLRRVEEKLQ